MKMEIKLAAQIKLLICNGSEIVYHGLKATAERLAGVTVVGPARTSQQAFELVEALIPDVVLVDVDGPQSAGVELIAQLKERMPALRLMAITGNASVDCVRAIMLAGADGICLTSITSQQLMCAVQSVFWGAVWLDPKIADQLRPALTPPAVPEPRMIRAEFLSPREQEVLQLLVQGMSNIEMAKQLVLSVETVKTHVRHIYEKLAVKHRTEAVVEAIRRGLVPAA